MPLQLLPATEADAAQSAAIEKLAYGPNPVSESLFPGPGRSVEQRTADLIKQLREDSACRWVKVVDSALVDRGENGMVAFAMWYIWEAPKESLPPLQWGEGTNPEACELFFGEMQRRKEERLGGKPHICKSCTGTSETYSCS